MKNKESAALLKQCDTGIRMGLEALERAAENIKNPELLDVITDAYAEHKRLEEDVMWMESRLGVKKPPFNPFVNGFSKIKSELTYALSRKDKSVAKLMSDGTYMGINALSKKLNKTPRASENVKDIAQEMIDVEDDFIIKLRQYL